MSEEFDEIELDAKKLEEEGRKAKKEKNYGIAIEKIEEAIDIYENLADLAHADILKKEIVRIKSLCDMLGISLNGNPSNLKPKIINQTVESPSLEISQPTDLFARGSRKQVSSLSAKEAVEKRLSQRKNLLSTRNAYKNVSSSIAAKSTLTSALTQNQELIHRQQQLDEQNSKEVILDELRKKREDRIKKGQDLKKKGEGEKTIHTKIDQLLDRGKTSVDKNQFKDAIRFYTEAANLYEEIKWTHQADIIRKQIINIADMEYLYLEDQKTQRND